MTRRERAISEVAALLHLVARRIERVVRIGEAHPTEERRRLRLRAEPRHRALGDPVGVIVLARDRVVLHLGGAGLAAAGSGEHGAEARDVLWMCAPKPLGVVMPAERTVRR